jgi:hypothetical protein
MTKRRPNIVFRVIHHYWPDGDIQQILTILNKYGKSDFERGKTRVHLAVLKLSEGNLDKLAQYVSVAKSDYRDVVAWAEYPEQIKLGFVKMRELSPRKRKALKKRDAKQYADWLKKCSY